MSTVRRSREESLLSCGGGTRADTESCCLRIRSALRQVAAMSGSQRCSVGLTTETLLCSRKVPSTVFGAGGEGGGNFANDFNASQFMQILTAKAAKDLDVNFDIRRVQPGATQ